MIRCALGSCGREGDARRDRRGSDDEDLRKKKAFLALLAVLILPVSLVWGTLYLAFGSPVGWFGAFLFAFVVLGILGKIVFVCRRGDTIDVKGQGRMETWYLMGPRSDRTLARMELHGWAR